MMARGYFPSPYRKTRSGQFVDEIPVAEFGNFIDSELPGLIFFAASATRELVLP